MKQSKKESLVEQVLNVGSGWVVSLLVWAFFNFSSVQHRNVSSRKYGYNYYLYFHFYCSWLHVETLFQQKTGE
jgi:hypothetical protein